MATNVLINILITAVISSGFVAAASPVMPAKPQHPTAQRQMALEIPVADQERIPKFLSLFDEAQKSATPAADPKMSGIKGFVKIYGKKVKTVRTACFWKYHTERKQCLTFNLTAHTED